MTQGHSESLPAVPSPHAHRAIVLTCGAPAWWIKSPKHKTHSQKPHSALRKLQALNGGPGSALPLCWLEPNLSESWKSGPGGDGLWFNTIQVEEGTLLKETVVNDLWLILLVDGGQGTFSSTRAQLVSNNCYIFSEIYCRCLNFNNLNNRLNQVEQDSGRLALLMKAGQLTSERIFALTWVVTRGDEIWLKRQRSQPRDSFLGQAKQLPGSACTHWLTSLPETAWGQCWWIWR